LRELPSEASSAADQPAVWGLRDYGTASWEAPTDITGNKLSIAGKTATTTWWSGSANETSRRSDNFAPDNALALIIQSAENRRTPDRRPARLEKTPEEYVAKMVEVFRQVPPGAAKDGTLWLNFGR